MKVINYPEYGSSITVLGLLHGSPIFCTSIVNEVSKSSPEPGFLLYATFTTLVPLIPHHTAIMPPQHGVFQPEI
jgi:hypothetical protein